jgi:hypothetical protein
VAAFLLGTAAVAGFGANELLDEPAHSSPPDSTGRVVAGMLVETPDTNPAAMVVPLRNDSANPVTVSGVTPVGWRAYGDAVTLPPGQWVDVPVWLTLECGRMPEPTDRLTMRTVAGRDVRGARTTARSVSMSDVPRALTELRHRLCELPLGRQVASNELVGTWVVEGARTYGGHLFVRIREDGRFALSSSDGRLDQEIMVTGRSRLHGDWLRLDAQGGWFCAPGDSFLWRVGVLSEGWLRIGHETYYDNVCQVDDREVWVARRIS